VAEIDRGEVTLIPGEKVFEKITNGRVKTAGSDFHKQQGQTFRFQSAWTSRLPTD
jgi:hypothetical protein